MQKSHGSHELQSKMIQILVLIMSIFVFTQKKEEKKIEGLKKVIFKSGINMIVLFVGLCR